MSYRFRPKLIPTLAALLLLPAFIALGFWQLHRAQEKLALQADYDRRSAGPTIALDSTVRPAKDLRFYRVSVTGYYEPAFQILLDNRVHDGVAGYYVLTPLHIRDSHTRVLVNRGWLPLGKDRAHPPAAAPPAGLQKVTGIATVPLKRRFVLGNVIESDSAHGGAWAPVWQYIDLAQYGAHVPFPLQPVVILLDPASAAGGYVRQWERLDTGMAVNRGYAFQWFALALALITLYLFVNIRSDKRDSEKSNGH